MDTKLQWPFSHWLLLNVLEPASSPHRPIIPAGCCINILRTGPYLPASMDNVVHTNGTTQSPKKATAVMSPLYQPWLLECWKAFIPGTVAYSPKMHLVRIGPGSQIIQYPTIAQFYPIINIYSTLNLVGDCHERKQSNYYQFLPPSSLPAPPSCSPRCGGGSPVP